MSEVDPALAVRVDVSKPILLLLVGISAFIGLLPAFLALGAPLVGLIFASGYVIASACFVARSEHYCTVTVLDWRAYVLGGVSAIFYPAVLGVALLLYWIMFYVISWLANSIVNMFGSLWAPDRSQFAFWSAVIVLSFAGIGIASESVATLTKQLYPTLSGTPHAFFKLLTKRKRQLIDGTVAALVVLIVGVAVFAGFGRLPSTEFYIALQVYFFYLGAVIFGSARSKRLAKNVRQAMTKLLKANGYDIKPLPRTGDPAVDPYLAGIDFFAQKGERSLIVDVQHAKKEGESLAWTAGLSVKKAAAAVKSILSNSEKGSEIDPFLFLVGITADETLRAFSQDESVRLVELGEKQIHDVLQDDESAISALAIHFSRESGRRQPKTEGRA